jgi:hypothetical protein
MPKGKTVMSSVGIIKHYTIMTYGGVEVYIPSFLTSAIGGGE